VGQAKRQPDRWTRFNRRRAEEHHIPWGCGAPRPAFSVYDLAARRFDEGLLAALMD
jgi:hypothetical protein